MIRGCVGYTLSIMPKFCTDPPFQLAVLNFRWGFTFMVDSAFGLTSWFGPKNSSGSSFLGPSRCGHPLGRECVHSQS